MSMSSANEVLVAIASMPVSSACLAFIVFISILGYFSAAHRCGVEARLERNGDTLGDDLPDASLGIGGGRHDFPQRVPAEKAGARTIDAVDGAAGKLLRRTLADRCGDRHRVHGVAAGIVVGVVVGCRLGGGRRIEIGL